MKNCTNKPKKTQKTKQKTKQKTRNRQISKTENHDRAPQAPQNPFHPKRAKMTLFRRNKKIHISKDETKKNTPPPPHLQLSHDFARHPTQLPHRLRFPTPPPPADPAGVALASAAVAVPGLGGEPAAAAAAAARVSSSTLTCARSFSARILASTIRSTTEV